MQLPYIASPALSVRFVAMQGPARFWVRKGSRGVKLCSRLFAGLILLWANGPYGMANTTCMAPNAAAPCRTPASLNQNSPEPQINLGAGNPVHLATGNKYQYETDLLPSAGWPLLAITRHYSAQNRRVSFMGQGWHSDFDMRLRSRGPETVIEQADGHTVAFRRIGPGLHASSQHGQLHTRTDGWRWQRGHGQQLDFNAQGWLIRVRGPAGHALAIDRHTAPGPLQGAIKTVSAHRAGHQPSRLAPHHRTPDADLPLPDSLRPAPDRPSVLTFTYTLQSGHAYLAHIDSPAGRFSYDYETAVGDRLRLAGMRRPDGSQRRYRYDPAHQGGNPFALTQIENIGTPASGIRQRQGQWAYNAANQVVAFGEGPQAYQLAYGLPGDDHHAAQSAAPASAQRPPATRTRLRRADGAVTDVYLARYPAGQAHVTAVTGAACPGCPAPGTRATHDPSGRLLSINGTQIARDDQGRLQHLDLAHTGWAGLRLAYNTQGQRYAWQSHVTGREHLQFNPHGLVAQRHFADGQIWHYDYDTAGRPLHVRQGAVETRLRWRGNLLMHVQHPAETESRDYDDQGRMVRRTLTRPAPTPSATSEPLRFSETFAYDSQHRLTRHTLAEGGALHYTWGHGRQLTGLVWETASGQRHTVIRSQPDRAGYRYGNGLQQTTLRRGQDLWQVLVADSPRTAPAPDSLDKGSTHGTPATAGTLGTLGTLGTHAQRYQFDAQGRVIAEQWFSTMAGFDEHRYAYNRQSRLIGATTRGPGQTTRTRWFAHDEDGAALQIQPAIVRTPAGLPARISTRRLHYGEDRRLKAVWDNQTPLVRYAHNAFGHRIWRRTVDEQTHYWYLDRRVVAESTSSAGSGALTESAPAAGSAPPRPDSRPDPISRRYLYAHHVPVGLIDYTNEASPDGTLHFVHADLTGAPHAITDTQGHTVWTARYSPWGHAQTRGITFNLRAPGQYHDPATGWHDNLLRTYDPEHGQFLEPDPLGPIPGNQNLGYASQQPRRFIDPTGLLLFAFDGTRNDASTRTNIWKLSQRYHDGPVAYEGGPGNPYTTDWDAITAYSAPRILDAQWQALLDTLAATPVDPKQAVPIDIIGYSRGAALARHFGNQVSQYLSNGQFSYHDQQRGLITACVDLRFMGVFDTVAQFGLNGSGNSAYDLTVDAGWQWVAHAVALHERRWLFPLTSAADTQAGNVVEAAFVGAHADIGGGVFFDSDGQGSQRGDLSDISLNWMLWQARAAGVAFGEGSADDAVVSAPYLHDDRNSTLRALQNGDRGVDRANGQLWHNYQDDTPRLGRTTREATETFIRRYDDWRRLPGNEVGTVDMQAYSHWLEQTLGTTVAGDSRYH